MCSACKVTRRKTEAVQKAFEKERAELHAQIAADIADHGWDCCDISYVLLMDAVHDALVHLGIWKENPNEITLVPRESRPPLPEGEEGDIWWALRILKKDAALPLQENIVDVRRALTIIEDSLRVSARERGENV